MENLLSNIASEKLSTYAAITLMFTYFFLLNRDFECSCELQFNPCHVYLILPVFIILLIILWTDRSFQRVCRYLISYSAECSSETTCNFLWSFIRHILKAVLVGLLWVAFVFLEGDWYVCCKNDHSEQQAPLACKAKAKDNITEKEQVIIAELKNYSRVIGGSILFGIILVASLIPPWRKCSKKGCKGKLSCCNKRFLYDKLILEEEDNVRKEYLRKLAKDKLNEEVEKIIKKGSEDFSNIAVKLLNRPENTNDKETQTTEIDFRQENQPPGNSPSLEDQQPGTSIDLEMQPLAPE